MKLLNVKSHAAFLSLNRHCHLVPLSFKLADPKFSYTIQGSNAVRRQ